ncbi:hypothetical protein [Pseudomonas jessenii]|uniref:hypothetical protein n=1 Tax=Pseudomonas jessenii TaxID=77298 RepID=UPI00389299CE
MKARIAATIALAGVLSSGSAMAVIYTDEPDPAYEALSQSANCMNHFYFRTSGHLSHEAGTAAQTVFATQLNTLHDGARVAEAIRMAFYAANIPRKDDSVPVHCWQFIPKEHGMTEAQLKYFLLHGADQK